VDEWIINVNQQMELTSDMLQNLQANIIRAHVRDHLVAIFVRFEQNEDNRSPGQVAEAGRALLHELAPLVTSAETHERRREAFRAFVASGEGPPAALPYVGVGLARSGYDALQVRFRRRPDQHFFDGMRADAPTFKEDLAAKSWDDTYKPRVDAVVLVGGNEKDAVRTCSREVRNLVAKYHCKVAGTEVGRTYRNGEKYPIEHFGFVDGRSQPLFDADEIAAEEATTGISQWDPTRSPRLVLVPDLVTYDPATHLGSYLVFRKLEQNVKRFHDHLEDLARELNTAELGPARSGALVIGRYRDGTPLAEFPQVGPGLVTNNFNYADDEDGMRCPMFAHVRTMNPRGGETWELMARRGVTYGDRQIDPATNGFVEAPLPEKDVGLLFMAFNSNIEMQFVAAQTRKVNGNPDLLVGPDGSVFDLEWPVGSVAEEAAQDHLVAAPWTCDVVTMKGGEYFFMPSKWFLKSVRGLPYDAPPHGP
jgi:Dyp-type peroxidase family